MRNTPKGTRLHIAIFGRRNAGKSSLINALTRQDIALVSSVPGTTTDPVYKAMEILPLGPVMLIDTAGIDDEGTLGKMRVERTLQVLNKTDMCIFVIDATVGVTDDDVALQTELIKRGIKSVGVVNKTDTSSVTDELWSEWEAKMGMKLLAISAVTGGGMDELKLRLIESVPSDWEGVPLIGDLVNKDDMIVLVTPIDSAAPKGRLILPQVMTIRDILDHHAACIVTKEDGLQAALDKLAQLPSLVVTDSQEFERVSAITPPEVMLTSFSILMARHKGDLQTLAAGARAIDDLQPGDRVLVAEGCTHHSQKDDIGTVKIPRWLKQMVGGDLAFEYVSGGTFPKNLSDYKLIIHCGACMLNRKEMLYRLAEARAQSVPIVNYGVLIAKVHGILERALAPFPLAHAELCKGGDKGDLS